MDSKDRDAHKALTHPVRRRCLAMIIKEWPTSPNRIAKVLNEQLSLVAYHVGVLAKYEAVELVDTKARRGATEHFYAPLMDSDVVGLLMADQLATASNSDLEEFLRSFDPAKLAEPVTTSLPFRADGQGLDEAKLAVLGLFETLRAIEVRSAGRQGGTAAELPAMTFAFLATPPNQHGQAP